MLGIVDDSEFEKQVEQLENGFHRDVPLNEVHPCEVIDIKRGRGAKVETPESLRKVISECAIDGEPVQEIAKSFDISPSSISAYKHSATSTASYHNPDKELAQHNSDVRTKITKRATTRIMQAMKHITEDKLRDAKLKDVSSVAKDMSAIVKNISPDANGGITINKPQYIIYSPRIRKEDEFEVVEAVNE